MFILALARKTIGESTTKSFQVRKRSIHHLRVPSISFITSNRFTTYTAHLNGCNSILFFDSPQKKMDYDKYMKAQGSRLFSTNSESFSNEEEISSKEELINPADLFDGKIPYPKSLSPSSVMEFMACPQSFLFQYLYKIRQPPNLALAKGSMCHSALEKVFDLEPRDRTVKSLHNLLRVEWRDARQKKPYLELFKTKPSTLNNHEMEWDFDAEKEWGQNALQLLSNYVKLEDPRLVISPNPVEREIWVNSKLTLNAEDGVSGYVKNAKDNGSKDTNEYLSPSIKDNTFLVRGIVDRIDLINLPNGNVVHRIVDYKSGKSPEFKYTPEVNRRIANENFFQLKIYALLLREMISSRKMNLPMSDIRILRLLYLTSTAGEAQYVDMDLGETQEDRDMLLQEVHEELSSVWKQIHELVDTQDPHSFQHCDRPFCFCHKTRPKFVPGSVWESSHP